MLQKLNTLLVAFTLGLLDKVGLKEKTLQVAYGGQAFVDNGMTGMLTPKLPQAFVADTRGQLGFQTILAALVVVIGVSLAVIIVDRFDSSLGEPSSSALSDAQTSVLSGFADMAGLVGPLLLVAIAIVIIGLLRQAR